MKNYQVTAQCVVHIPMSTSTGAILGTLYRGATFNGDPDTDKIKHLLDSGMIVELGKDGQPLKDLPEPEASEPTAKEDVALPPTSGAGSGQKAWADYAIANGMNPNEANAASREALIAKYGAKSE